MKKEKKKPLPEGPMNYFGLFQGDPMGSYTGLPTEPFEKPVQDADDL